jgi:hypothetical protein
VIRPIFGVLIPANRTILSRSPERGEHEILAPLELVGEPRASVLAAADQRSPELRHFEPY